MNYGISKVLDTDVQKTEQSVREALSKEGFGIISRIDMKEKFREKLGVETEDYIILGACNPPFAYEAVKAEKNIGLMLPCNVILYPDKGKTTVAAIKPAAAMGMIDNPELQSIAEKVEKRLERAINSL